jgi:hypothetical protein
MPAEQFEGHGRRHLEKSRLPFQPTSRDEIGDNPLEMIGYVLQGI